MEQVRITEEEYNRRINYTLNQKIDHAIGTIEQFYNWYDGKVYIAFSGGKDSTVLLWLARKIFPRMEAVFIDTGLEYPEIREFVKTIHNVTWVKPKMTFGDVLKKYGFPVVSKEQAEKIRKYRHTDNNYVRQKLTSNPDYGLRKKWLPLTEAPFEVSEQCCQYIKKHPARMFESKSGKRAILGTMASESRLRKLDYLRYGCNSYHTRRATSRPLAFWTDKDIWEIIRRENIKYSKIYDMGYERTGCMFCMFGVHLEGEPNRFQLMAETHPKLHDYCINKLGLGEVLKYIKIPFI